MLIRYTLMAPSINATASELIQYVKAGLRRAVADARHPWRLPVLITSKEGRIVVLRGIDNEGGAWRFFTDRRTPKVEQLAAESDVAAATFYHPKERTQVRLKGIATQMDETSRNQYWATLGTGQRSSYGAFSTPGSTLTGPGDGLSETWTRGQPTKEEEQLAFKNFAVFSFQIQEVELLLLHREGHRRCRWEGWKGSNFRWLVP